MQTHNPEVAMPDARAALERFLDAVEARDTERILEGLSDDVTIETELLEAPIRGKETVRQLLEGALDAYESVRLEEPMIVASDGEGAALVRAHALFRGDLEFFGERLSTAGKAVTVAAAAFVRVDESGRIKWLMRVRDTFSIVRQLGISTDQMERILRKFEEEMGRWRKAA